MTKEEIQARIGELTAISKQIENQYVKVIGMIEENTFQLSKMEEKEMEAKEKEAANQECSSPEAA